MKILITFLFVLICSNLYGKKGPVTNLELPRFVSLKSDERAKMGLVSDIHTELRKADALKLNYSSKTAVD